MPSFGFLLTVLTVFQVVLLGQCKTLQNNNTTSSLSSKLRRIDNFVDFTQDGDQLAVESSTNSKADAKGDNLENEIKSVASSGRDCANVQQVLYPIIPVIIGAVVCVVGAIIIAYIGKAIAHKHDDDKTGYGDSNSNSGWNPYHDHGRRSGLRFLGLDNMDFTKVMKSVLTAIESVY